jgi:hypothetical protein
MIRWLTGIAGAGLALFGVFRLLTEIPAGDLLVLAGWLAAALFLHDGVLAPLTAAAGAGLTRFVPQRLRRYLQGALVAGACAAVVALPLIYREGSQPPQKAILRQDYVKNLAILLGLIAGAAAALYLMRVLRDQRASEAKVRPPETQTSSQR